MTSFLLKDNEFYSTAIFFTFGVDLTKQSKDKFNNFSNLNHSSTQNAKTQGLVSQKNYHSFFKRPFYLWHVTKGLNPGCHNDPHGWP